jgi:glycosyltransferase involved in cell wall biosynthesis
VEWLPARPRLRRYDFGWRALRWARGWGADLLYTRLPQAAAFASLAGQPAVLEIHDLPQGLLGPAFFRAFLRGRGARRLVTISRALLSDLVEKLDAPAGPPFTIVAPDGVDLERFADLPPPEQARARLLAEGRLPPDGDGGSLSPERFTAGYTGHLYPGRGADLILELAARLPEMLFLLAGGEPEDLSRLRQAASARGARNLLLAGFVPNAELPVYQAACEALLMPYQRRVAASSGGDIGRYLSPLKLFEYLACGRAILCSDLPPLREVLTPQNAVLLPPEDAAAWAAALQALREDPPRRVALAAQARRAAERHTWTARAARILEGL